MVSEHDPEAWLKVNPAAPASPTLLSQKDWDRIVRAINAPPNNATAAIARSPWIGAVWEQTPWGGMQRARFVDDDGSAYFAPIRFTVLPPGSVHHGRCTPARGHAARLAGIWLRDRVTGDLGVLRDTKRVDPHADLPGRRQAMAPSTGEGAVRAGARVMSLQRMRVRAVVGAGAGLVGEQLVSMATGAGPADLAMSFAMLVAGGAAAVVAPFVAGRAGRGLSRPLVLFSAQDPRSAIVCVLQYYLAHRADLGDRADVLILEAWRLLYHAAGADSTSAAAMAELDDRARALVDQAYTVAELLDAKAAIERAAARPRVQAIEQEEDEQAIGVLNGAPNEQEIAELTHELELDAAARRAAAERLDKMD